MPKITFNIYVLNNLPAPVKATDYQDKDRKGLLLRVSPSGKKVFYYRYHLGKHQNYKIGAFPGVRIKDARNLALDLERMVSKGIDPQKAKKEELRASEKKMTFSELVDRFKRHHLPRLKPKTQADYTWMITKHLLPAFGRTQLQELRRRDVSDFLEDIAKKHPTQANRLQAVMSSILSYGLDKDYIEVNPIHNLKKKGSEVSRDRVLNEKEIRKVWKVLDQQEEPIRTLFKFLLLCGQRSGETKRMKWEHIRGDVWVIPAEETKKSKDRARDHHVPLSDFAQELLNSMKPHTGKTPYVFASQRIRKDKAEPVTWLQKAVKRIRDDSGVTDFRIHDIRRTVASNLAKGGESRTVIGKVLNHADTSQDRSVTAIYDQHDYLDEKREALNKWSQRLLGLLAEKEE